MTRFDPRSGSPSRILFIVLRLDWFIWSRQLLNRFLRTLTLPQMLLFAVHFFEIVLGGPEENVVFWANCGNVFSRHCRGVLRVAYTLWCGDGGLELLTYWSASRGAHDWLTNCLAGPTHTVKGTLVRLSVIFWKPHSDERCSLHSTRNCETGDPRLFAFNYK